MVVSQVIVGDSFPCVNITIVDDMDRESCENFTVVLSTSDPSVTILSPSTSTVIIYDNEGLLLKHNSSLLLKFTLCLSP